MHIAYLTNQYPKVSHTFIRREIHALERRGFQVCRIAIRGWDAELVDVQDQAERERTRYALSGGRATLLLAVANMLLRRPLHLLRAIKLAWEMSRHADRPLLVHFAYLAEACRIEPWLRAGHIEHIHAHFGTNSAEVAMLVRALGGPPWSFTVHGPEEFDKAPLLHLGEKVRRANFVVTISSFGRSQLFRLLQRADWTKVHVVRCGLERRFFDLPERQPPAQRRLICVGRLCEQKGQMLLVEAARRLAAENQDFELILAGDGEHRSEIEQLVKRYDLADRIRITGWISSDQVKHEISGARALVIPSFAEGLPVALMEAMALCRPVISTYVAGIPELVTDGETGWLVPAGDVAFLADAMSKCLNASTEELKRMGHAARAQVFHWHDVDKEADKLARLFLANPEKSA